MEELSYFDEGHKWMHSWDALHDEPFWIIAVYIEASNLRS